MDGVMANGSLLSQPPPRLPLPLLSHTPLPPPFWYGHNPTIFESRCLLSAQSSSFQSFQQEPTRPRREWMKEGQEEKRATVFWVF
jgi:hypothetical protein